MSALLGIDVMPVSSPEKAVGNADIVATCTNAGAPVFTEDYVSEGMFLVDTKSNEVDSKAESMFDKVIGTTRKAYLASEDYVVGQKNLLEKHKQLHGKRGFEMKDYAILSEIIQDPSKGRNKDEESIYCNNRSMGIQFAAICDLVHRRSVEEGLGIEIPSEWFQQDLDRSYS
jgi:ornithine cyclodeaminase/alanine dehydrogenase-like protein (mu-crystallin family)